MSVDGEGREPMELTTSLPQGSPISPVPFAIYIAEIHASAEGKAQDSRGISFVYGVTWVEEGTGFDEVVDALFDDMKQLAPGFQRATHAE